MTPNYKNNKKCKLNHQKLSYLFTSGNAQLLCLIKSQFLHFFIFFRELIRFLSTKMITKLPKTPNLEHKNKVNKFFKTFYTFRHKNEIEFLNQH